MAQNEVQVKVTSEISNAKTYEKDMASIAKKRLDEINELKRAEKISAEQLADLKQRLNSETFDKEKQAAMRLHKLRVDNAKKESVLNKDISSPLTNSVAGKAIGIGAKTAAVIGTGVAAATTVGVKNATSAVSQFEEKQNALLKMQALAGKDFNEDTANKVIEGVSKRTPFNGGQIGAAINGLIQGGKSFKEATDMIGNVADLAISSGKSIEEASSYMINASNIYGISADKSARAADVMTKATNITALDFDNLQNGLVNSGYDLAYQGLERTVSQLGALASVGYGGSESGTALKSLKKFATSEQGQSTLAQFGVAVTDQNGNIRAIDAIFGDLKKQLDQTQMDDAEKLNIWKKVAGEFTGAAQVLAVSQSSIASTQDQLLSAGGATSMQAGTQASGLKGLKDQFVSAWENGLDKIGSIIAPIFEKVYKGIAEGLNEAFNWVGNILKPIVASAPNIGESAKTIAKAVATFFTASIAGAILMIEPIKNILETIKNAILQIPDIAKEYTRIITNSAVENIGGKGEAARNDALKELKNVLEKKVGHKIDNADFTENYDKYIGILSREEAATLAESFRKSSEANAESVNEYKKFLDDNKNTLTKDQKETIISAMRGASFRANDSLQYSRDIIASGKLKPAEKQEVKKAEIEKLDIIGDLELGGERVGDVVEQQQSQEVSKPQWMIDEEKAIADRQAKANSAQSELDDYLEQNGISKDSLNALLSGQFEVASKFSGTTASMSSYAQFDWEASGVDEKQLESLKNIQKNAGKIVELLKGVEEANKDNAIIEII